MGLVQETQKLVYKTTKLGFSQHDKEKKHHILKKKSTKKHFSTTKNTTMKKKHKTLLFFKNTCWEDCLWLHISTRMGIFGVVYLHHVDTHVNTDYFSLYTFHKIINMWKWKTYFKISNCGFRLELNASCNKAKIVKTGEMLFAGKWTNICRFFLQMLLDPLLQFLHYYKMHLVLIRIHGLNF